MTRSRATHVFALVLWMGACASAGGFAINEQGARAMAQAGAFAARASDPSAIFFNPAGITQLDGIQFYFGGTAIKQKSTWESGSESYSSKDKWEFPPSMYMTYKLNDRFTLGLGLFTPFGLSKQWPADFPGRYSSQLVNLLTMNANTNLAVKLTDGVSFAFGLNLTRVLARLDRALDLGALSKQFGYPLGDGYFSAKVNDWAIGWNAAFRAKISEKMVFGFSYRSQMKTDLKGDLTLVTPKTSVPVIDQTLAALFPNQQCETKITLPDNVMLGIGGNIYKKWDTEVDFQWTNWADYKSLPFYFSKQTPALKDAVIPKNWRNGWILRWGNEYHYSDKIDIRCGLYYDGNPVPDSTLDPMLPDSNRVSVQGGFGWHKGPWVMDFAYMYLHFLKRDIMNDPAFKIVPSTGLYKSSAHLIGLSLGYRF